MKRREATLDAHFSGVAERTIEVECTLPDVGWASDAWYLPITFLPKGTVSPELTVTDGAGSILPVPTRQQNLAITKRAIDELIELGRLDIPSSGPVRDQIDEIIAAPPLKAYVAREVFERTKPVFADKMGPLLRLLEDHFVLWAPAEGAPLSDHHFRISRCEINHPERIIVRRRREVTETVPTALELAQVQGLSSIGWPTIRRHALIERLLHVFALRPIEGRFEESEAKRVTSSHVRFKAPPGFLVRNVRVGELFTDSATGGREVNEFLPSDEDVVIQGWDTDLGHVHLSKPVNPERVYCRMTLGLRGGMNTLWMLATLLTAALLWVVHHHSRYGPILTWHGLSQHHFQFVTATLADRQRAHGVVAADNKQIAAAALLVGPAFASAWSLRAEGGELLRSALAGARVLLLVSAALSVAAALALADVLPTDSGRYAAVEIYATMSYFVAVPMAVGWFVASRPVWDVFRSVLNTKRRNVIAVQLVTLALLPVGFITTLTPRFSGLIVLAVGLILATIAANSIAEPLPSGRTLYRPLAGIASLPVFVLAGSLLGFYTDHLPLNIVQAICLVGPFVIAAIWGAG